MTRYYVYHWVFKELDIPGVFQEGEPSEPNGRKPHWIEIPDDEFAVRIKELSKLYDVMLLGSHEKFPYFSIYLDDKGRRFRQR